MPGDEETDSGSDANGVSTKREGRTFVESRLEEKEERTLVEFHPLGQFRTFLAKFWINLSTKFFIT